MLLPQWNLIPCLLQKGCGDKLLLFSSVRMCYLSISSVWRYEVGCCHWEESQQWKPPVLGWWSRVQDLLHHWGALEGQKRVMIEGRAGYIIDHFIFPVNRKTAILNSSLCKFTLYSLAIYYWHIVGMSHVNKEIPHYIICLIMSMDKTCLPVMSTAFSEVRFSMLPLSPAGPPGPNAAISSMSDRRPALWDLHHTARRQRAETMEGKKELGNHPCLIYIFY